MSNLNHVSLSVGKLHYECMRDFYRTVLAPLSYSVFMQKEDCFAGFAPKYGGPDFWLHADGSMEPIFDPAVDKVDDRKGKTHVAFTASSRRQVDSWYENAM